MSIGTARPGDGACAVRGTFNGCPTQATYLAEPEQRHQIGKNRVQRSELDCFETQGWAISIEAEVYALCNFLNMKAC
jgi:hypothetical protein